MKHESSKAWRGLILAFSFLSATMFASDVGGATPTYASVKNADLGIGASLNGDVPFPADNAWNRDVSADPIDPNSDALIASIGLGTGLHPDFGADIPEGPIGIPYVVVSGSQQKVTINFTAYGEESDPGPYPIPGNAPIEGGANAPQGSDRHVLVIDRDNQKLYELFNAWPQNGGSWNADSGAVFDLTSNVVRPGGQPGWTSADAAGLPIFPGLVRYDEVASGAIHHALRFTVSRTRRAYVPPATHWASSNTDGNLPPMGMRVRLKASYPIPANVDPQTRVLLQALKTYGMIVADNGSNWFITGTSDQRWNNDALVPQLRSVSGSNFEVIRMDGLVTDGPAPQLLSPQAITGDWYDPAYDGSGFNVTMTPTGLILFYYGWDNSGHRLWLISDIGPTQIAPGTAITLNMNETVGGHFLTPATPSTLSKWGTLTLNFAADGITASATLDGNDGKVGLSLQKLAGMANTSSVTGDWYDPAYNGSGFNMLVAPQGLILFYYGWDSDGNRLWLISDVTPTQIVPGTPITLNMSQTSGGHFLAPAKPASTLSSWGTLKLDFSSCTKAIGSLTSTDGSSTVTFGDLQMIGGVMDMPPGC